MLKPRPTGRPVRAAVLFAASESLTYPWAWPGGQTSLACVLACRRTSTALSRVCRPRQFIHELHGLHRRAMVARIGGFSVEQFLSLIHISEPTRQAEISY